MLRALLCSLFVLVAALFATTAALAHDSWVNRGAFKNGAGEWCCGDYDCKSYTRTSSTGSGWMIDGELVPFDEAMPVAPPDGQVTICRRPDGSRRCVFGLKPGL
jgi:hypothetical protein